jgi:hypothetical protein
MGAPKPTSQNRFYGNLFAKRPTQQVGHPANKPAQVDRAWFERLLTGERKKSLRKRFSPARAAHRVFGRATKSISIGSVIIQVTLQRFQIAYEYREQIVEIVGYPARELTNPLHLLRLSLTFLRLAPLCEIARHLGEANEFSIFVTDRIDNDAGPKLCAILADPPALHFALSFASCSFKSFLRDSVCTILVRIKARKVLTDNLLGRIAFDPLRARVPITIPVGSSMNIA